MRRLLRAALLTTAILLAAVVPGAFAAASDTAEKPAEPAAGKQADGAADKPAAEGTGEDTPLNLPEDVGTDEADEADEAAPEAEPSNIGSIGRLIFGLIVVVGTILVIHRLIGRASKTGRIGTNKGASDLVEVLTTTVLAPNRTLHLVRIGKEIVLVGATEQSINHLQTLDRSDLPYLNNVTSGSEFELALTKAYEDGASGRRGNDTFVSRFVNNLQDLTAR